MKSLKPVIFCAALIGAAIALVRPLGAQYVERFRAVTADTNGVIVSHADLVLGTGESLTNAVARLTAAEPGAAAGATALQAEADTLDTVADRGATTDKMLTAGGFSTTGEVRVARIYDSSGTTEIYNTTRGNLDDNFGWIQIMPQSGQFSGAAAPGASEPSTAEGYNAIRFRDAADFAYYPILPPPPGATSLVMRTLWATDAAEVSNAVQTVTFQQRHTRGAIGEPYTAQATSAKSLSATNAVAGSVMFELSPTWEIPDGVANTNSIRQRITIQRASADTSTNTIYLLRIRYRYQ